MDDIWTFLIGMTGSRPIEILAVALGITNVVLIIRRSIWNYPFGIVMVILYAQIFYEYRLYSDALLQIYFLLIQIYGLWHWLQHRQPDGRVMVERWRPGQVALAIAASASGAVLLGTVMGSFTDADLPYWDAAVASTSVVAQFLLSRRVLQSWLFWIAVDIMAIALFWVKDLQPTAALYGVFLVLAAMGYLRWLKAWRAGLAV